MITAIILVNVPIQSHNVINVIINIIMTMAMIIVNFYSILPVF